VCVKQLKQIPKPLKWLFALDLVCEILPRFNFFGQMRRRRRRRMKAGKKLNLVQFEDIKLGDSTP